MIVARAPGEVERRPDSVVTVGTFDGVHLGHRAIIREVVRIAGERRSRSVVITFDPHPRAVVASQRGPVALLTTLDERLEVMRELGVDVVYIIRFTLEVSRLGAREFYETEVVGKVGVREVVVGHDHKFGHDRSAGQNELFALGRELGFGVRVMPPLEVEGAPVSSTRIRHALASGNAGPASILLGSPYTLAGVVVRGDGRGRQLGFPTANLQPDAAHKIIPAGGVYAVEVLAHGSTYGGMMNIGVRPTVTDGSKLTCEIHLFRFSGDLYGERLTVRFLERLREERRFPSVDRLLEQLELDREATRAVLAQRSIIHSAS